MCFTVITAASTLFILLRIPALHTHLAVTVQMAFPKDRPAQYYNPGGMERGACYELLGKARRESSNDGEGGSFAVTNWQS